MREAAAFSAFVRAAGHTLFSGLTHTAAERQIEELTQGRMRVWARNVRLYLDPDVMLLLEDLLAEIHVDDPDLPLIPERTDQFAFHLVSGRMRLEASSVTALLAKYLFPAAHIPLQDPRARLDEGGMRLTANLDWGPVHVPIVLAGSMRLDADRNIEVEATRVEAGGWGLGGLLALLRTDLERVLRLAPGGPVRASGNRLRIDPEHIFPSPRTRGRPAGLALDAGGLTLWYESGAPLPTPPLIDRDAPAYLFCLGHALLVGKMFLHDAVFQVVPRSPEAPMLDFSLADYRQQLAAGESTMKQHGELLVRLPNLSELTEPYSKLNGRLVL